VVFGVRPVNVTEWVVVAVESSVLVAVYEVVVP
jgi:hypothetical protein